MIIDTHVHIGFFRAKDKAIDMNEEMVLRSMELYGINYSLVSNAAVEYDCDLQPVPKELQPGQEEAFARGIAFARKHPDKIGVLPWVKAASETADETLEAMIRDNLDVVRGIKVHPFHSKTAFDSPRVEPFLRLAQKYSLPVAIHTGGCDEASPVRVYNAAKKFPDVKFVMVHMGLGTDNQEAIELMGRLPNLYADTTWVPVSSTLQILRQHGSKRLMFGSDNPIDGLHTYHHNPKGEPSLYQQYFHELEAQIGEEAYADIMYRNAIEVFGLERFREK